MASSSSRIVGFRAPTIRAVRAPLRALPMPIRVVQLTDLHFGLVTPRRLIARAVEHAQHLRPDLVVLTGDFVCRGNRWVSQIEPTLRPLAGDGIPVVAVLGNHDHFVAADAVRRALERAGATVLQNRWARLPLTTGPLWIAGLDDSTTGHDDLAATVAGLPDPRRHPVLGLTHNPAAAPDLWSRGIHAVLSGHTHAGQFVVPGVTERFYRRILRQPYVGGMNPASPPDSPDDAWVYVSAGVGAGAVPWRIGAPAAREVTHLTLGPG